jgi:transposase
VRIVVTIRRFTCLPASCPQATFSEQIPALTKPFVRRTALVTEQLVAIALALAGRAGSRLATTLGMPCGRDMLIGLIRAQPIARPPAVTVLGVDDFAFRKGHTYGTILIDMASHRPIDVLADREATTLAAWLAEHPGIEIVCRDRAGAYAQGIQAGAPTAIQVADRFHLWKNLCEVVGKTVITHHGCLRVTPPQGDPHPGTPALIEVIPPGAANAPTTAAIPQRRLVTRTRERFDAVHRRLAAGLSRSAISRELNLDIQTVRRFANATGPDELLVACQNRSTNLDGFIDQVNELWNTGCHNGAQIAAHITERGYTGSVQSVRRYLRAFRVPGTSRSHPDPVRRTPAPSGPAAPKPRKISQWLLTHPDHLAQDDTLELDNLLTRCEHLNRLHEHVRSFAALMTARRGPELTTWLRAVEADDLPALRTFATGIRRDLDAVTNGLTLEHSSGADEGAVGRLKMLKRQTFGRANFDLLRARVLLTT